MTKGLLAIVFDSPFVSQSLSECLQYANNQVDIVLLQDAAYACIPTNPLYKKLIASKLPVYVLMDDLQARGIVLNADNYVKPIDIAGFVALTEKNPTQISW